MSYKRIFILGAGSSIGHSNNIYPSITDFFSSPKISKLDLNDIEGYDEIALYINKTIGKDVKKDKINIEDILTHVEIEIERNPSPDLLSVKQSILAYIRNYLLILSKMVSTKNGEYDKLIEIISKSDTIITYNWDLLLDNILGREYELQKIEYEYSGKRRLVKDNIQMVNIRRETDNRYNDFLQNYTALGEGTLGRLAVKQPYDEWDLTKGFFIKAHGSIDWLYCSNEACREYRKVLPVLKLDSSLYCSACHETLDCLIIPPVLNKGYRYYPLIRVLWNLASIELAHADEMVVWGYSLPPTDFYAKWLLRQARQKHLAKLTIINPEVINIQKRGSMALGISFIKRFHDLFRDIVPKESFLLYRNYKDYIDGQHIFKKYLKGKSIADYRF